MEFKDRLRQTRRQKQISQEKLADLLGLTKQAVSHYERGSRKPDQDTLLALADILNVSTDYLLGTSDMTAQYITEQELYCLDVIKGNPCLMEVINSNNVKQLIEYAEFLVQKNK